MRAMVDPVKPCPGSTCVAPAEASAPIIMLDVVPGALISICSLPSLLRALCSVFKCPSSGVELTSFVSGSNKRAGNVVIPANSAFCKASIASATVTTSDAWKPPSWPIKNVSPSLKIRAKIFERNCFFTRLSSFSRLIDAEYCPIIWFHLRCFRKAFSLRNLNQMSDMSDTISCSVNGTGACHVNRYVAIDTTCC